MAIGAGGMFHHRSFDVAVRADAMAASSAARSAKTEVALLESEIERLLMISEALGNPQGAVRVQRAVAACAAD